MRAREMTPLPRKTFNYVYVKMLRAQADAVEGKLRKGDVLVLEEEKATRWVFRARIAAPATREEFEKFQATMRRTRAGSMRLARQPMSLPMPDENPFEYVEQDTPEWQNADATSNRDVSLDDDQDAVMASSEEEEDANEIAGALETIGRDADQDEEDEEVLEYSDESPGVYDQSIDRGPGEDSGSGRGRRANRRR